VVFEGLSFENKPSSGTSFFGYQFLQEAYTIYSVWRKPGLPVGYSMKDMADDYAAMIQEEFGGPVDVIGISTGGSIVQHFAADHPELVRRLVIHSSAHTLSDHAKQQQLLIAKFAAEGRWARAYGVIMDMVFPKDGIKGALLWPVRWTASQLAGLLAAPKDPSDLVITVQAEDKHAFKERLGEISAPTLVIAGENDPFYTTQLFRETAEGIPHARLVLYAEMGHPAAGKQFQKEVADFLMKE
jgi:pimeloyl-ACP methyl ester carboxylesterase